MSQRAGFDDPHTTASGPVTRWHWETLPEGTFLAASGWRSTTPTVYREFRKP